MNPARPRTATVRGIELGRARPEIIVPLVGDDEDAVLRQAEAATASPARLVEWRLDRFRPDLRGAEAHREAALSTLTTLRGRLGADRGLLVTFRTPAEGGERPIEDRELGRLLTALVTAHRSGAQSPVDLVDVETARTPEVVERVIETAHGHGVVVVGSFHDMAGTPETDEMVERLRGQRRLGVDVPKIAVTPQDGHDVLRLLWASLTVEADGDGPHIAISMGSLGAASRVAAEAFGSAATFATVGEPSAPGQLGAPDVARMLDLLRP